MLFKHRLQNGSQLVSASMCWLIIHIHVNAGLADLSHKDFRRTKIIDGAFNWRRMPMLISYRFNHEIIATLQLKSVQCYKWIKNGLWDWQRNVIILTKFSSLDASDVVNMTTSVTNSDKNVLQVTFLFQWLSCLSYDDVIHLVLAHAQFFVHFRRSHPLPHLLRVEFIFPWGWRKTE